MSVGFRRVVYGLIIAVIIVLPPVFLGTGFFSSASDRVLPGVEAAGIKLGGLNKAEGVQKLAEIEKDLKAARVTLRYGENSWPLLVSETGFDLNEEAVMASALSTGRTGSVFQRWQERQELKKNKKDIPMVVTFDREKLAQKVNELVVGVTHNPVDAGLKINKDETVSVVPGKDGTEVDVDRLIQDMTGVLLTQKYPEVALSLVTVQPARSTAMVEAMGVNGLLAAFSTQFDASKTSRSYNISVAARALDELLIRPEHEVSFNKVVGPRSSEAGYKNAKVIVG
ncbi:MAG: peptidoglycan binding domain-containing protein, partial [Firmicutes bacterium]|nr:peptidoglycan binding domain-containing protein [Bacillota bacterium]